ncbi:DUF4921 family protein [Corynebacterium mayonis]|uniref:DUF4921 family protein n=1 Tax=Corynebacterium mayonis TaxID=3062461 RepID=UPI0031404579
MTSPIHSHHEMLATMADGTIKQINPFSGTQVWTVPGRGDRPLNAPAADPVALSPADFTSTCAFCSDNMTSTPPEKTRIVQTANGWEILRDTPVDKLHDTTAQFRRVPNLFEIVSYDYWNKNYDYNMPEDKRLHMQRYLADDAGREHLLHIARLRLGSHAQGRSEEDLLTLAPAYFGGGHDVVISRRHFIDGAHDSSQLASSGSLSPEEHRAFIRLTIDGVHELFRANRYAPYVAVFQNWLSPAGASFDHLHKQLVAIDERGASNDREIEKLRANQNMYNEFGVNYAFYKNLVIAENEHAILIAGIGHRYPTVVLYSKSAARQPWQMSEDEQRDFSDLLHAAHAATGAAIACNEEWHYTPIDLDIPMPLRVNLKWRVSTLAGFEGGTRIYVNTLSPYDIRDRVVTNLYQLRAAGRIADTIGVATECTAVRNSLRYNPAVGGAGHL